MQPAAASGVGLVPAYAATGAPVAVTVPWWSDPRFQLPAALVGGTLLAVGTFAALHFALGRRPTRDDRGWRFPEKGYLLCAEGMRTDPTTKELGPGTFVVVWLGDADGEFVEATWAEVVHINPADPNELDVRLIGEHIKGGLKPLQTDRHGFRVSEVFRATRDCIADALVPLRDPKSIIVCGAAMLTYDGPDDDTVADGFGPAMPEKAAFEGQPVLLLLAARGGVNQDRPINAWVTAIRARVTKISETGQIPTVEVEELDLRPPAWPSLADVRPGVEPDHDVKVGDTFDITWDCVLKYL